MKTDIKINTKLYTKNLVNSLGSDWLPTEKSKQAKQKLLEIFSKLNKKELQFLRAYFDESPHLDEATSVIVELLQEVS